MEKPAQTQHPIHDLLRRRWSPRAFSERGVEPAALRRLFEAARWASSSFNEQPWRFIVATKDDPAGFDKALSCLVEKNQAWAKGAPVLVLTCFKKTFTRNGTPNRVAMHDLGQAVANLVVQAMELDLFVHQMAGIVPARIRELYQVPEDFEPATAIALGYAGELHSLPEEFHASERGHRSRHDFTDFVFSDRFGDPSPIFGA